MKITVQRFNPKTDSGPHLQNYNVPDDLKGRTVSEALEYIFENIDPSLAFYRSCMRGLCGACGAVVNGKAGMLCMTRLKGDTRVEPLKHFKIVRDLVTYLALDLCRKGPS